MLSWWQLCSFPTRLDLTFRLPHLILFSQRAPLSCIFKAQKAIQPSQGKKVLIADRVDFHKREMQDTEAASKERSPGSVPLLSSCPILSPLLGCRPRCSSGVALSPFPVQPGSLAPLHSGLRMAASVPKLTWSSSSAPTPDFCLRCPDLFWL